MTEPSVEILLVQCGPQQIQLTLDLVRSNGLANRIHVVPDGAEALEFLFRSGAYAGRTAAGPRLILFHLRLADGADLEVLSRITHDPRTAAIPITVLASSGDDRIAAMSELRQHRLQLPVVVIARPTPLETVRALARLAGTPREDDHAADDVVAVVAGADEAPTPAAGRNRAAAGPVSFASLCLEREHDALVRLARDAAHEFNNVFSVFVACTEMLLKDVDLDDVRRAGADDLFKTIGRASRLTREILAITSGTVQPSTGEPPQRPASRAVKRPTRQGVA